MTLLPLPTPPHRYLVTPSYLPSTNINTATPLNICTVNEQLDNCGDEKCDIFQMLKKLGSS